MTINPNSDQVYGLPWRIIKVDVRQEFAVEDWLVSLGTDPYCPRLFSRTRPRHKKSAVLTARPMYPGYLFIQITPTFHSRLLDRAPGNPKIFTFCGLDVSVRDREIQHVKAFELNQAFNENFDDRPPFELNQIIRIDKAHPWLGGMEAKITALPETKEGAAEIELVDGSPKLRVDVAFLQDVV